MWGRWSGTRMVTSGPCCTARKGSSPANRSGRCVAANGGSPAWSSRLPTSPHLRTITSQLGRKSTRRRRTLETPEHGHVGDRIVVVRRQADRKRLSTPATRSSPPAARPQPRRPASRLPAERITTRGNGSRRSARRSTNKSPIRRLGQAERHNHRSYTKWAVCPGGTG